MTLGDDLLEIVDDARAILGPDDLDLRPTACTIIVQRWTGGVRGRGMISPVSTLELPKYTKVKNLSSESSLRELANTGGRYETGDLVVGPITPFYRASDGSTGGFTEAQLAPRITDSATEIIYRLVGQDPGAGISGDYSRLHLQRDSRLRFMLLLTRQRTTPGPT